MQRLLPTLVCLAVWLLASRPTHAEDWSLTRPKPKRRAPKSAPARPADREARLLEGLGRDPQDERALHALLRAVRAREGQLEGLLARVVERQAAEPASAAWATVLGHIEQAAGHPDLARDAYRSAIELDPNAVAARLALADLLGRGGDAAGRARLLSEAILHVPPVERPALRRALAEASLDAGDLVGAQREFEALRQADRDSLYAATEYARALSARGHAHEAVAAYQTALSSMGGDARARPSVWIELARAQLAAEQRTDAIGTLERAIDHPATPDGLRGEARALLVDAHRQAGSLAQLVEQIEHDGRRDFATKVMLARIRDELGDTDAAIATLRGALKLRPRDVDAHLHLLRLLSRSGDVDGLIAQQRQLIRLRPGDHEIVMNLAEMLLEAGRRNEGLASLDKLAQRGGVEPRLLRRLHDVLLRWGERTRALAVARRLTHVASSDPDGWVLYGEALIQRGQTDAGLRAFSQVLKIGADRAGAHARLGAILLDHGHGVEAARHYETAVKLAPDRIDCLRGFAEALERVHRAHDAVPVWLRIVGLAADDRVLRREARRHVVDIWASRGELNEHLRGYEQRFASASSASDDGLEAGRFVVEGYLRLARGYRRDEHDPRWLARAEAALERLLGLSPQDVEALLALERLRTRRGDTAGAITVLRELTRADPPHARGYLERMTRHALSLYRDRDALSYAQELAARYPDDAQVQLRLAELYRVRKDVPRAVAAYRRALELDPLALVACLELAELLVAKGELSEARRLWLRVVASATEEPLVVRAARALMQQAPDDGTHELEGVLLPRALAQSGGATYRRLLVEAYGRELDRIGRAGSMADEGDDGSRRARLTEIGHRAIKPLLEALSDQEPQQQRTAVAILVRIGHPAAAEPLLAFALGDGPIESRRAALIGVALQADRRLATRLGPRLSRLATGSEQRLRPAAAWALARMADPALAGSLLTLADEGAPAVRGYALLGLAAMGAERGRARAEAALRDVSPWVRVAGAIALGEYGDPQAAGALSEAFGRAGGQAALGVLAGMARLPSGVGQDALAHALFAADPELRRAAQGALAGAGRGSELRDLIPPPDGRPNIEALIRSVVPTYATTSEPVMERLGTDWVKAMEEALSGPREQVLASLDLLAAELEGAGATSALRGVLLPLVLDLQQHPAPEVRARVPEIALRLGADGDQLAQLSARALSDRALAVRGAALDALLAAQQATDAHLLSLVARAAVSDDSWAVRRTAVRLLARWPGADSDAALGRVLAEDDYALVRAEAVAVVARALPRAPARTALLRTVEHDVDLSVRLAAVRALRSHAVDLRTLAARPGLPEVLRQAITGALPSARTTSPVSPD